MTIPDESSLAARALLTLPDDARATLVDWLEVSASIALREIGRVIAEPAIPGDGPTAVALLAIDLAHVGRLAYMDGELSAARDQLPTTGELWAVLRAALADDIAMAQIAAIDEMMTEAT
jgi:hypothetical protein